MTEETRLPVIRRFPVEEGHIQLFARAIGDANPVYSDPAYAARSRTGGIIAPPTFSEAGNHFDENWPYRPRFGQPWFGSAATPTGAAPPISGDGTQMHAATHFVYHQPLRPGMTLSVNARPGKTWSKWGERSGTIKFHEIVATFVDAVGIPILDCTTVVMETERTVDNGPAAQPDAITAEPAWSEQPRYPVPPFRRSRISVGDAMRVPLVRNLSRAQIIQYAGVSGDFSPQHIDEIYNTKVAGYPTVFAHGMLTMGMASRVITDFVGDGRLRKYGFEFRNQVWPGDSLFAAVEVVEIIDARSEAKLQLTVTNQYGRLVGKGYAEAMFEE